MRGRNTTGRLGEKAKPKADLPQHGHLQAVSQGYTGEELGGGRNGETGRERLYLGIYVSKCGGKNWNLEPGTWNSGHRPAVIARS